ncbi:hypothetical protein OG618_35645 [Kitasatospora sp. NBC_01246]|uniref:hypothetical protein n=1 Tax=unclassified Kitasatospora TaxID=2633591 RepID=UPI002E31543C|nr:hypothetical protein [Kitasatospora sp. NBC_01246]
MTSRLRKTALAVGLTAVASLSFPAVSAAAAPSSSDLAAVTCGNANWPHSNLDPGSGTISASSAPVRTGPYGACTLVGSYSQGVRVDYDCYSVNDYGNTWTYVRGPAGSGWIYDANLSNGGSTVRC